MRQEAHDKTTYRGHRSIDTGLMPKFFIVYRVVPACLRKLCLGSGNRKAGRRTNSKTITVDRSAQVNSQAGVECLIYDRMSWSREKLRMCSNVGMVTSRLRGGVRHLRGRAEQAMSPCR